MNEDGRRLRVFESTGDVQYSLGGEWDRLTSFFFDDFFFDEFFFWEASFSFFDEVFFLQCFFFLDEGILFYQWC